MPTIELPPAPPWVEPDRAVGRWVTGGRGLALARGWVRATVAGWGWPAEDAVLVVSELVTNAHRAGAVAVHVRVVGWRDSLLVEVYDDAAGAPVVRAPGPEAVDGRGLAQVVAAVCRRWGWSGLPGSRLKCVWAELPVVPAPG